jgi:hypothetical protein
MSSDIASYINTQARHTHQDRRASRIRAAADHQSQLADIIPTFARVNSPPPITDIKVGSDGKQLAFIVTTSFGVSPPVPFAVAVGRQLAEQLKAICDHLDPPPPVDPLKHESTIPPIAID